MILDSWMIIMNHTWLADVANPHVANPQDFCIVAYYVDENRNIIIIKLFESSI